MVTSRYGSASEVAGIARSTRAGRCPRRRRVYRPNYGELAQSEGTVSITGLRNDCVHKESRDGGVAYPVHVLRRGSPAKQTPIPCSGSFPEACTAFSEGWAGLEMALLAGLRWQRGWAAAGSLRTGKRRRANSGEVWRVCGRV